MVSRGERERSDLKQGPRGAAVVSRARYCLERVQAVRRPSTFGYERQLERAVQRCLQSFLYGRGEGYSGGIYSPVPAAQHGSRLSPYLAWGNLSMRSVVAETRRRQEVRALPLYQRGRWLRSLRAFDARLHWHYHFILKLESEPEIEHNCFIRSLDAMGERTGNEEYLRAWC